MAFPCAQANPLTPKMGSSMSEGPYRHIARFPPLWERRDGSGKDVTEAG